MRTSDKFVAGRALREACIIVYGFGHLVPTPELIRYILKHGMPNEQEREDILAARFAAPLAEAGDNQAELDVPAGIDQDEDQSPDHQA